MSARQKPS